MFAYDHNHVAVLVCGRFGLWPFWFVAVLDVILTKKFHKYIQITPNTLKVISQSTLFNPFTGHYMLNKSKSSEKFHCPQN